MKITDQKTLIHFSNLNELKDRIYSIVTYLKRDGILNAFGSDELLEISRNEEFCAYFCTRLQPHNKNQRDFFWRKDNGSNERKNKNNIVAHIIKNHFKHEYLQVVSTRRKKQSIEPNCQNRDLFNS